MARKRRSTRDIAPETKVSSPPFGVPATQAEENVTYAEQKMRVVTGTRDALLRAEYELRTARLFHVIPGSDDGILCDSCDGDLITALEKEELRIQDRLRRLQPQIAVAAEEVADAYDIYGYSVPPVIRGDEGDDDGS